MKMLVRLVTVLMLGLSIASCGAEKNAATAAIQTAEGSFAAVRDQAMKIVPDGAAAIDDAIAAAKASLEGGDAKAALAAAKDLPAQIAALSESLAGKEAELRGMWDTMNASVPAMVGSMQVEMEAMVKRAKLPSGTDQAAFDGAKSTFESAKTMWADAQSAIQSGNLAQAVSKGQGAKDACMKVMTALKMKMPAEI